MMCWGQKPFCSGFKKEFKKKKEDERLPKVAEVEFCSSERIRTVGSQ